VLKLFVSIHGNRHPANGVRGPGVWICRAFQGWFFLSITLSINTCFLQPPQICNFRDDASRYSAPHEFRMAAILIWKLTRWVVLTRLSFTLSLGTTNLTEVGFSQMGAPFNLYTCPKDPEIDNAMFRPRVFEWGTGAILRTLRRNKLLEGNLLCSGASPLIGTEDRE